MRESSYGSLGIGGLSWKVMGQVIGYARVSSVGQSLDVQLEKLTEAGCERMYQEKVSGTSTDGREQLAELLRYVREGTRW